MSMLFPQLIKANLKTNSLGRDIQYYQRLPSTNLEAFELIEKKNAADGTVIITDQQFQGKGRQGRSWFSSPGKAVTFSVILQPNIPIEQMGLLSLATGIATVQAIEKFGIFPTLKWPNDIILSEKKCGGILVQTRLSGTTITWAIIGIGLNVNEHTKELPEELQPIATTLSKEKGSPVQRELIVAWTLNALESVINAIIKGKGDLVKEAWLDRCNHLNKLVTFRQNSEQRSGIFLGITDNGSAVIKTIEGETIMSAEEISLRP